MVYKKIPREFIGKFLASLSLCLGGGWVTGILTQKTIQDWYPHLIKAPGTPPNFTFPLVWSLLYILMALSLTSFWMNCKGTKKKGFLFFGTQLFLNFSWSFFFFYLKSPILGLIDIILLCLFILLTIQEFFAINRKSAYLLIPYLIWTIYALYLNIFIFIRN